MRKKHHIGETGREKIADFMHAIIDVARDWGVEGDIEVSLSALSEEGHELDIVVTDDGGTQA